MSIPTYEGKYDAAAVVTPAKDAHIYGRESETTIPEAVILSFQEELFEKARDIADEPRSAHGMPVHPLDEAVGVVGDFGMDAPLLAGAAERLIAADVSTLCIIGSCASLQRSTAPGETILPDHAIRDEGTSYHYIPADHDAIQTPALMNCLQTSFADASIPTHTGSVWTTDAFFRETIPEVRYFSEEGVLGIEIEAAALFAVAEFHGIDAAAVLDVHDYVTVEEWGVRTARDHAALRAETELRRRDRGGSRALRGFHVLRTDSRLG